MILSRFALTLVAVAWAAALAAQSNDAETAFAAHRERIRAAIDDCAADGGGEIVVCGEREDSDRYRLPFDVAVPGDLDNETVMEERVRLQANPGTCQLWSYFRAFCGSVGVSAGIGGGRPAGLRPRED